MRQIEGLERRRLFSFDLAPTSISDIELANNETQISFFATIANLGDETFQGNASVDFFLTRDGVIGNTDDLRVAGQSVSFVFAEDSTQLLVHGSIPESATGVYRLGAFLHVAESNTNNNKFVTSGTVTVTRLAAWTTDTLSGTAGNDVILITPGQVNVNGDVRSYPYKTLYVDAGAGNDKVVASPDVTVKLTMTGSGGNDTLIGGAKADGISGGNGKDKLFGGLDDDDLLGGAGNDYVNGEAGNDICRGAGGNDRVYGLDGFDYLLGGAGDDVLVSRDLALSPGDTVSGNGGFDRAQIDDNDGRASIEQLLD